MRLAFTYWTIRSLRYRLHRPEDVLGNLQSSLDLNFESVCSYAHDGHRLQVSVVPEALSRILELAAVLQFCSGSRSPLV